MGADDVKGSEHPQQQLRLPGNRHDHGWTNRHAAIGLACLLARHGWPLKLPTGSRTPAEIWTGSDPVFARMLGLPPVATARLLAFRQSFDAVAALAQLETMDIEMVALGDPGFPLHLSRIHDPPPALFVSGKIARLERFMTRPRVAIVGARAATSYGLDAARLIAEGLSRAGACVISGLALGIDAAAHEGSLRGDGGALAVLGCGTDTVYPRANTRLYRRLIESGLVVSEYPPGTEPRPWRFPARNRIIAGLADAVVVVEAREKSGALITADFCLEEGRDVWAVPGSIFSQLSAGPHKLIRMGAMPATGAQDILEELGIAIGQRQSADADPGVVGDIASIPGLSEDERLMMTNLGVRPVHQDELSRVSGLDGARTATALVALELKGVIRRDPVRGYSL
ncbi:MAG: DNA-processing protein DprA [Thermoleophilia bacterium]